MQQQRRFLGRIAGGAFVVWALGCPAHAASSTKEGARRVLPTIPPRDSWVHRLDERRDFRSPDGRYVAQLQHGEANVWTLHIVDRHSNRRLATSEDVTAIVWVPGHAHWLVVAACGIYGRGQLALRSGTRRWRSLRRVKRPTEECFTLYGVTADGQIVIYGHDPDINREKPGPNPLYHRRRLRMPTR
jgi:hypothetical protein